MTDDAQGHYPEAGVRIVSDMAGSELLAGFARHAT
jgi:hypothetical protein